MFLRWHFLFTRSDNLATCSMPMNRLAAVHLVTDRQTDRQTDSIMPMAYHIRGLLRSISLLRECADIDIDIDIILLFSGRLRPANLARLI